MSKFRLFYVTGIFRLLLRLFGNKGIFQPRIDNPSSQGATFSICSKRFGRFFPHVQSFFRILGVQNWSNPRLPFLKEKIKEMLAMQTRVLDLVLTELIEG